jgi:transcriptional regulator with XRE-family HTH domain
LQIPRLRECREARALTQEELAERAGISARSVAGYEAGSGARPGTVRALAAALEVEVAELTRPKEEAPPSLQQTFNHVLAEEERRAKFGSWAQSLIEKNEAWLKLLDALPEPPNPREFECGRQVIREMFNTIGASITGLKNYGILDDVQVLVEAKQAGTPVPDAFDKEVHLLHGELLVLFGRIIPKARNWYTRFEERAEINEQLDSWAKQLEEDLAPLQRNA